LGVKFTSIARPENTHTIRAVSMGSPSLYGNASKQNARRSTLMPPAVLDPDPFSVNALSRASARLDGRRCPPTARRSAFPVR